MDLASLDITQVNGIGKALASTLAKLGIQTVQDLLFHLPYRYVDKTRITPIAALRLSLSAVVQGNILKSEIMFGKRRSLAVTLEDTSGKIVLRFFHFSHAQKNRLVSGTCIRCFGEPRLGTSGLEFYHPEIEFPDDNMQNVTEQSLTPVYNLTEGISQLRMRKLAQQALALLDQHPPRELLPLEISQQFQTRSLAETLKFLHRPPSNADVAKLMSGTDPRQQRLAFEELLAHFLARQRVREKMREEAAPQIAVSMDKQNAFLAQFDFSPTGAQLKVVDDILADLTQTQPMLRMIQGDVGSGKTLVAAIAALHSASNCFQVALVAPTEILAEQHYHNFQKWFELLQIPVELLVSKMPASKKQKTLGNISSGKTAIVIGTHALFQDSVAFAKLGLIVIDEQHRFGVEQRKSLQHKSACALMPHQLIMTATPIPRTLAMTAYSEMDYSVIDELPPGRTPVETVLISQNRRQEVIDRICSVCTEHKQVYWVCTLIENSETLSAANAEDTCAQLQTLMPKITIQLIHGKLKPAEKDQTMQSFKRGDIQVLVATTVIEVGVDVPNASLMVIENPERLGLAQLHQLRGRVGRGAAASYCVLLYGETLSNLAKQRLQVMRQTSDGFVIADKDLQLRGPGEFLGTRQTGDMAYRVADGQRDAPMLNSIHSTGRNLLQNEPETVTAILNRWFGNNQGYARV